MAYRPDQIDRLKKLIHDHLEENSVFSTAKQMLEKEALSEILTQDKIIETLSKQGLVNDVISNINVERMDSEGEGSGGLRRYVLFKLLYGKAFVDFLSGDDISTLQVHVSFLRQNFSTPPVSCCVDPIFNSSFLLDLCAEDGTLIDFTSLLKLKSPIQIVVTRSTPTGRELVSTQFIEWRGLLSSGTQRFNLELHGQGAKSKLSVGVLYFQADLMPTVTRDQLISDRIVQEQLDLEARYERDIAHGIHEYANEWWKDYKAIRSSHENRMVKIFATTEDGSYKPVSSLVQPVRCNRMIDSPLHAARFISLIPFEREEAPGGLRSEVWHSNFTFATMGKGDCEDHALLLCGLLIGYGIDAYVCLGSSGDGPHAWVLSRGTSLVFWESLTGQRIPVDDPRVHRFYRKVGCVFNHLGFYGNIQSDDSVVNTNWELENESIWKPMAREMIQGLVPVSRYLTLDPPRPDNSTAEVVLETKLKEVITQHRQRGDLMSLWDEDLSYLLGPALVNYELDRVGSVTFGNEEFQESIKRYVPEGHTFKAYPVQFNHESADRIMASLLKANIAADILSTRGDQVRFALRVKIVPYPHEVQAVWLMLAVRFRSIKFAS